jgi:tetratricopeptide (TPR) repeat protein
MTIQAVFDRAVALHKEGRLAEAGGLYRQVLAEMPGVFAVRYRLATLLFQQQRLAEALAAADAALALDAAAVDALVLKGAVLAAMGRRLEALAVFDKTLSLKPGTVRALYNRALLLLELGKLAEAVEAFDRLLALTPDFALGWSNRGAALQALGRLADALTSYDRAVALKPDDAAAWHNRGIALQSVGRFAEALESFDKTLKIAPDHPGGWQGRGSALAGLEQNEEALAAFDKALAYLPGNAEILQQRAILVKGLETQGDARAQGDAALWYKRASRFHVTQRFADALDALDRVLAMTPDDSQALILKGAVLCEARRVPEGLAVYRRHAEHHWAGRPVSEAGDPPHKQRHDEEQRAWLAARGIADPAYRVEAGARIDGPAVNPANRDDVARRWAQSDPQIVVIDNLLTAPALESLRRFCWGSTVWRRSYEKGYLGAVPAQGFACPLLAQIADELRDIFPTVIGAHGLGLMWGFKYDSRLSGIPMHADQAAVNVNFWIAPDEANRDPESGGLVVWDVKAPQDWDFARYNADVAGARAFLAREGAKPIVIPHRANRAVIFDSDLFHETDRIDFKEGYENRRINVTMLYGRRTFHGG